ncbi:YqaJ viral recombinase family protein [uncultured Methylophaga sp.]|uniref:YqaJ viral recombinase family protein n=1 Tax=uncultured Methylophaga sp. TaxID=285271 RepID=UPI0030F58B41
MLSEEMLLERAGNFTASENFRLMAGWDAPDVDRDFMWFNDVYNVLKPLYESGERKFLVGDLDGKFVFKLSGELIQKTLNVIKSEIPPTGLVTYAEEKAMETLFDFDPSLNFSTAHTRNGEERELECMEKLSEATGLEFLHTGDNQVHIHANEVGCTPDGVIFDELDLVQTGAEVKCKSPLIHAKNLLINTNQDLMKAAFDHFVQVQTAMLVTGTDYWYFANYNPYAKRKDMQFKHIIIYRDDAFIKILKKRIEIAKKIKADFLSKFYQKEMAVAA